MQYYETDKMGITHHSNYVRWMEEARIDFFNKTGFSYKELESMGLYSPVVSVECSFKMPTTFEDCVEIEVRPEEFKGVKFVLSYEMRKCGSGDIVSTGRSVHCFIDMEGRLVLLKRTHPELNEKMKSIFHE